ncbi:MAG TPA: hypothetical protein VLC74_04750 [Rhizomicrobium sp.]|nr:hypothetical protein [Rhizomicrobium sp.]
MMVLPERWIGPKSETGQRPRFGTLPYPRGLDGATIAAKVKALARLETIGYGLARRWCPAVILFTIKRLE